jgi:catechol 2,3-dioxygenase-like lactoylglutathione lyase family enzyme
VVPRRSLGLVTYLCRDYDEAAAWFTASLGFQIEQDVDQGGGGRWLVLSPGDASDAGLSTSGASLLLALAATDAQQARVGSQVGDCVVFFLSTTDFKADYAAFEARGVAFLEAPRYEPYGTVAVFRDLYGNTWDLIERPKAALAATTSTKQ